MIYCFFVYFVARDIEELLLVIDIKNFIKGRDLCLKIRSTITTATMSEAIMDSKGSS